MLNLKQNFQKYPSQAIATVIIFSGIFLYLLSISGFSLPGIRFIETIENKTKDARFRMRGSVPAGNNVVIGAIDEKSLHIEGKWPWPRAKIAKLIRQAEEAGASVIAFDVGFFEPDDRRAIEALMRVKKEISLTGKETARIDDLIIKEDNDRILAETIKSSNIKVVLGFYFNMTADNASAFLSKKELEEQEDILSYSQLTYVREAPFDRKANDPFLAAHYPETNIRILADSAQQAGFFNALPDTDGIVRSMPVFIKYKDFFYAPLSLMALSAMENSPMHVIIDESRSIESIKIGDVEIPSDNSGRIWINFRGGSDVFPRISVTDIINGKADTTVMKDKILIIGATALGLFDLRSTPFGTGFPGCEIHANLLDSILTNDLLPSPDSEKIWTVLIIILTGLALSAVLTVSGAITGLIFYISILILYCILCQYLFSVHGLMLNMLYPISVMTLVYIPTTVYRYLSESKKKKFISNAFSTYLAPTVVKQILKSPEKLNLGGEDREITAFFSDVQGFTSISEKLTPKELVELLNEFLTEMTDIILKYEGTVDKFEGDAIIAFFGAPNDLENHSRVACLACRDMQERLAEMNEFWIMEGKPELLMRAGLCSGTAVVGNMGSRNRMDYTMMGDVVNTAARLEGVNKYYGTYSMISETTKNFAGPDIETREIDTIYLVGKYEPVTIYEVLPQTEKMDENKQSTLKYYAKGLALYKKKEWKEAIRYFSKGLSLTPDDGPSETMLKRCRSFTAKPPAEDWNTVFRITSK